MAYSGGSDGWTCPCFCCCCAGVPVRAHWTFFFVWILQIVISLIQYKFDYWVYIVNIAVLWGPLLALICVLHEWGHITRTKTFGGTCHYMVIWPLGGFSDTNIENGTCLQEFWVALCGPLMHIPWFIIFVIVMAISAPNGLDYYSSALDVQAIQNGGAGIFFAQLCKGAIDMNMMLFFLNLLVPAYPLDAARMLAAMSVHCGLSVVRAAWMLVIVGGLLGLAALIFGVIGLITGHSLGK
jgi:Zn-dependent protease